ERVTAFFIDAADAVASSVEIAKYLETLEGKLIFSIGLSTGKPVDEHGSVLFEKTKEKVNIMSRLGFQLGLCMDLDTKRSASRSKGNSNINPMGMTVVDPTSFEEIEKLDGLLMKNLNNSGFNSTALCKQLGLSKTHAHRKISSLFGKPPNKLLCDTRLIYAARALKKGDRTVSEIAY